MTGTQSSFVLACVLTLGLALVLTLEGPLFPIGLGALLLLSAFGTEQLVRRARAPLPRNQRLLTAHWVLPVLLLIGAALFLRLPFLSQGPVLAVVLVATALLLLGILQADRLQRWPGNFSAEFISYVIAFAHFTAVYAPRVRSIYSATAIAIVAALLCVELLRREVRSLPQAWLYAAIVGLCLGEVTWALNHWSVTPLVGGLALLLIFYLLVGLSKHAMTGRLTRQVGLEYGVVTLAGLLVVLGGGLWLGA